MKTIKSLYDVIDKNLQNFGIRDSSWETDYIISKILNFNKVDYYLFPEKKVCPKDFNKIKKILYKRYLRQPLPYIFEEIEFYGFRFKVNDKVLIPRQETELIVESAIREIKKNNYLSCADIGTGCGNIAISIAKLTNIKKIFAVDIDKEILHIAKKNAKLLGVNDRLKFIVSDIFSYFLDKRIKLDLIVSNPPYVTQEEYQNLQPEIYFEPIRSLVCEQGLDIYKKIADKLDFVLNPLGKLILEINPFLEKEIKDIFFNKNFFVIETIRDYNNFSRGLIIGRY